MKRILLTVLAASLCNIEPSFARDDVPFDASTVGTNSDVIAFVGKKVFVLKDETWSSEQDPNIITIPSQSRYKVRFEIIHVVSGDYDAKTIDFYNYNYEIPTFNQPDENVLLFVHNGPEDFVLSKYNYYFVKRTTDGDWADCGYSYIQYDPEETEKEPLEALTFIEPYTVDISAQKVTIEAFFDNDEVISDTEKAEAQSDIDEEYREISRLFRAPIWSREGDTATCLMGTRVQDLLEFQNRTYFLRDKREEMCSKRYPETSDKPNRNWHAERTFMEDCTDLLKIQNLP